MRVYQRIAETLGAVGVDTVFGLMGDANLLVAVSFVDEQGGRFVTTLNEGGAVSMADGYARTSGRVGVASVTHGPGVSNCITALTEAVRARSRVVLLTGDTPAVPDHLQRFDLRAAATLAGAGYVRIGSPDTAAEQLVQALATVESTSRPFVVDVPVDLLGAEAGPAGAIHPVTEPVSLPAEDELDRAMGIIAAARRPLILAGRGAVISGAREELLALADATGALVGTSLLARGYFREVAHDLGVVGGIGHPEATEVALRSDCVVAFGAGLNRFTTADGALLRGRPVVQVDTDRTAIGRVAEPDAAVVGDARETARAMRTMLAESGHESSGWRGMRVEGLLGHRPRVEDFDGVGAPGTVDIRAALLVLDEMLPDERLVVTDTGRFIYPTWRLLGVRNPLDFVHTLNFASIGLGIATGIGVAAAHPDRMTVVVAGDGGGMMGLGELVTAVREKLPLVIVIANDSAYGMEYRALERLGLDPMHSRLAWPSFAEVARGYGARAHTVTSVPQLRQVLAAMEQVPSGPLLIELVLDAETDPGE